MNQKDRVLKYIKDFGSITCMEAFIELGVTQLGARIDGLVKDGHEIKTEWQKGKNRYGEPVSFKKYSLKEMIEENENHIPSLY